MFQVDIANMRVLFAARRNKQGVVGVRNALIQFELVSQVFAAVFLLDELHVMML